MRWGVYGSIVDCAEVIIYTALTVSSMLSMPIQSAFVFVWDWVVFMYNLRMRLEVYRGYVRGKQHRSCVSLQVASLYCT